MQSGNEEYYLSRCARPADVDPWALPKMSDDEGAAEPTPAKGNGATAPTDGAPPPPMRILSGHTSQLTLFQDISVRGKFTDPKTGKQKTMTKRLKVLKMGAPFSHPHKVPHFMPAEWPTGQRFDPNDLTIAANPDGSELKHFPWVPGMHEQHEQLVKFNQHIRKESGLNKDTQFSDQGKWPCKLPNGTPIELPYWPESAFHSRRKRSKADEGDGSSMDNGATPADPAPPAAKKPKSAAPPASGSVPPAAAAGKAAAIGKPTPAAEPSGLIAKGRAAPATKNDPSDAASAEKAFLTKIYNSGDEVLKHIAMACLEDLHAPCGRLSSVNPWTCTGTFQPKSVKELKEDLEAEDPDDPNVDKLLRDLSSFRKLFKLLFSDVPPGWTPAAPPKKVSKFVVD